MGRSVADVSRDLEINQSMLAIWEKVVDFLTEFVDTELREAQKVLVEDTSTGRQAPKELIEFAISVIVQDRIDPLKAEIDTLRNLEVVETSDADIEDGFGETEGEEDPQGDGIEAGSS